MKIGRTLAIVALALWMLPCARAQFTAIAWNGSTGTETPVNIGAVTPVNVDAYPGMNYALLAAKIEGSWSSDIGHIRVEINDPTFTLGIDGFNPSHQRFTWGFVNANGDFDFNFVPFPAGSAVEENIYFQTLAQDPTAGPFNLSLSNFVGVKSQPLVPQVLSVTPRSIVQGGTITLTGNYLNGTPSLGQTPVVTMGGEPLTVTSFTANTITATAPLDAHSGTIRVFSDRGPSSDLYYNVNHWVAVTGSYASEGTPAADLIDGHLTVIGQIDSATDVDDYLIHVEAGEELFVEVFNYDPFNLQIMPYNPAAWQTQQLNSELRFRMPSVPIDPLLYDNDGGPGFASAIGLGTAKRFVAPYTGNFQLSVASAFQYSTGYYVVNTWTKTASTTESPEIIGVHPNAVTTGSEIEIYCYGIDPNNPASVTVEFMGPNGSWLPTTPFLNSQGRLATIVPPTAKTGHLRVTNGVNLTSSYDFDDYPSFYLMTSNFVAEGATYAFSGTKQIYGTVSVNQEVDNYTWALNAGDVVTMRAFPYDIMTGRILKGEYFDPNTLDPEIRIGETSSTAVHVIDIHSGPGISAEIGGSIPPFVAPRTDIFDFNVRSWFYLTSGPYLLDVVVN